MLSGGAIALSLIALSGVPAASAAGPPVIQEAWASQVSSSSATVQAKINPNGAATFFRVDYLTAAAYQANLAASQPGFSGALRSPANFEVSIGGGTVVLGVQRQLFSLAADTAYRYRFVAQNAQGTVETAPLVFVTQTTGGGVVLADARGWEQVSPIDKNGGDVATPGNPAGGVFQAAANGQSVTYSSTASFGSEVQGAPPMSQYVADRGSTGWSFQNLAVPLFSGGYEFAGAGDPYQLFSADLARAVVLNGEHCRGAPSSGCAVAQPPLPGTDAPEGYQNYYLREAGAFTALLGAANADFLALDPRAFDISFAGSSPDLRHPVLSSCAALTANATEVPLGEGCDPAEQNLYEYSSGSGLRLINLEPAQSQGTPGAALAAQSGAVSEDGSRVYFTVGGKLFLRDGALTDQVDEAQGGGGAFQAASNDGSVAFFTSAGHLYRYVAGGAVTDLAPSGGVVGVLGASSAGDVVYYQDATALKRWASGTTTTVAAGSSAAASTDYPPARGTSRVSADGSTLLFLSEAPLTGYDNTDQLNGESDSQVFLYRAAGAGALACLSCNPTNVRPIGASTIPGAVPNGSAPDATESYKPRVLSADGQRVFFDSRDGLVVTDTNSAADVYEWEAQGKGTCNRPGGCVSLVSGGRTGGVTTFVDASADGSDAFFVTEASLVGSDPGAADVYDARVGGGFSSPPAPIPCEGDACQPLPSAPVDSTLTTLLSGPGNPPVRYPGAKGCKKGKVRRHGKCVRAHGKAHRKRKAGDR
jgi:hypothetical protein